MAKIYVVILPFLILLCFSCKKEMPVSPGFELSASPDNNTVVLNWPPVYLSGFKSINVYRSVSPIPDPYFDRPINSALLVGTVTDKNKTSFRDSNVVMDQGGTIYYKIVLNLTNRVIPSNEELVNLNGFSLSLAINSNSFVKELPESNLLYIINGGSRTICIVDYAQKKLIKIALLPSSWGNPYPVMNAGKPELFMMTSSNTVSCYDGLTFEFKYAVSIPSGNINDVKVKNGFLYISYVAVNYTGKILTYDLSTKMVIGDKLIYYTPRVIGNNIYISEQSDELFVSLLSEEYKSSGVVFKTTFLSYNLLNFIPTDSVVITHPSLVSESSTVSSHYFIIPSPDGKYLTCNLKGDILQLSNNAVHQVQTISSTVKVSYAVPGNYFMVCSANTNNASISNVINIYSFPGVNFVKTIKSPNSHIVSVVKNDFIDNDTIISYNIINKPGVAEASILNVFFNKINE